MCESPFYAIFMTPINTYIYILKMKFPVITNKDTTLNLTLSIPFFSLFPTHLLPINFGCEHEHEDSDCKC